MTEEKVEGKKNIFSDLSHRVIKYFRKLNKSIEQDKLCKEVTKYIERKLILLDRKGVSIGEEQYTKLLQGLETNMKSFKEYSSLKPYFSLTLKSREKVLVTEIIKEALNAVLVERNAYLPENDARNIYNQIETMGDKDKLRQLFGRKPNPSKMTVEAYRYYMMDNLISDRLKNKGKSISNFAIQIKKLSDEYLANPDLEGKSKLLQQLTSKDEDAFGIAHDFQKKSQILIDRNEHYQSKIPLSTLAVSTVFEKLTYTKDGSINKTSFRNMYKKLENDPLQNLLCEVSGYTIKEGKVVSITQEDTKFNKQRMEMFSSIRPELCEIAHSMENQKKIDAILSDDNVNALQQIDKTCERYRILDEQRIGTLLDGDRQEAINAKCEYTKKFLDEHSTEFNRFVKRSHDTIVKLSLQNFMTHTQKELDSYLRHQAHNEYNKIKDTTGAIIDSIDSDIMDDNLKTEVKEQISKKIKQPQSEIEWSKKFPLELALITDAIEAYKTNEESAKAAKMAYAVKGTIDQKTERKIDTDLKRKNESTLKFIDQIEDVMQESVRLEKEREMYNQMQYQSKLSCEDVKKRNRAQVLKEFRQQEKQVNDAIEENSKNVTRANAEIKSLQHKIDDYKKDVACNSFARLVDENINKFTQTYGGANLEPRYVEGIVQQAQDQIRKSNISRFNDADNSTSVTSEDTEQLFSLMQSQFVDVITSGVERSLRKIDASKEKIDQSVANIKEIIEKAGIGEVFSDELQNTIAVNNIDEFESSNLELNSTNNQLKNFFTELQEKNTNLRNLVDNGEILKQQSIKINEDKQSKLDRINEEVDQKVTTVNIFVMSEMYKKSRSNFARTQKEIDKLESLEMVDGVNAKKFEKDKSSALKKFKENKDFYENQMNQLAHNAGELGYDILNVQLNGVEINKFIQDNQNLSSKKSTTKLNKDAKEFANALAEFSFIEKVRDINTPKKERDQLTNYIVDKVNQGLSKDGVPTGVEEEELDYYLESRQQQATQTMFDKYYENRDNEAFFDRCNTSYLALQNQTGTETDAEKEAVKNVVSNSIQDVFNQFKSAIPQAEKEADINEKASVQTEETLNENNIVSENITAENNNIVFQPKEKRRHVRAPKVKITLMGIHLALDEINKIIENLEKEIARDRELSNNLGSAKPTRPYRNYQRKSKAVVVEPLVPQNANLYKAALKDATVILISEGKCKKTFDVLQKDKDRKTEDGKYYVKAHYDKWLAEKLKNGDLPQSELNDIYALANERYTNKFNELVAKRDLGKKGTQSGTERKNGVIIDKKGQEFSQLSSNDIKGDAKQTHNVLFEEKSKYTSSNNFVNNFKSESTKFTVVKPKSTSEENLDISKKDEKPQQQEDNTQDNQKVDELDSKDLGSNDNKEFVSPVELKLGTEPTEYIKAEDEISSIQEEVSEQPTELSLNKEYKEEKTEDDNQQEILNNQSNSNQSNENEASTQDLSEDINFDQSQNEIQGVTSDVVQKAIEITKDQKAEISKAYCTMVESIYVDELDNNALDKYNMMPSVIKTLENQPCSVDTSSDQERLYQEVEDTLQKSGIDISAKDASSMVIVGQLNVLSNTEIKDGKLVNKKGIDCIFATDYRINNPINLRNAVLQLEGKGLIDLDTINQNVKKGADIMVDVATNYGVDINYENSCKLLNNKLTVSVDGKEEVYNTEEIFQKPIKEKIKEKNNRKQLINISQKENEKNIEDDENAKDEQILKEVLEEEVARKEAERIAEEQRLMEERRLAEEQKKAAIKKLYGKDQDNGMGM